MVITHLSLECFYYYYTFWCKEKRKKIVYFFKNVLSINQQYKLTPQVWGMTVVIGVTFVTGAEIFFVHYHL